MKTSLRSFCETLLFVHIHFVLSSGALTSPQFNAHPSDVIVAEGQTAVLTCDVTGEPAPSVNWYRGDTEEVLETDGGGRFSLGGSGELSISSVASEDEGSYYCVASNAAGSVRSLSASLELAVLDGSSLNLPSTLPVTPQSHGRRDPVVLTCRMPRSIPAAMVTWKKFSQELGESHFSDGRVGVTLTGSLVISSFLGTEDNGRYSCFIRNEVLDESLQTEDYLLNEFGEPNNLIVPLEFVAPPTPPEGAVVTGDTIHLECFTTGTPEATVTWQQNGLPLPNSPRYTLSQASRLLSISSVEEEDSGTYSCVATNGIDTIEAAANLSITVPPTITSSFPALVVNVTEEVRMRCDVLASEGSEVNWKWRLNSTDIVASERVQYDRTGLSSSLLVTSVEEMDRGVYQCVAEQSSTGREAASNQRLTIILTPPTITAELQSDQLVFVGDPVQLPCAAVGYPPPVFQWTTSGGVLNIEADPRLSIPEAGTGSGALTISSAEVRDSSSYQCEARNTAGTDTTDTVQLRVLEHSVVVSVPSSIATSNGVHFIPFNGGATIPCEVVRNDGTSLAYEWCLEGEPVVYGPNVVLVNGSLALSSVRAEQRGQYECVVQLSVSGLGGVVLRETVGSVTIGVGEEPHEPSPPLNPTASSPSSHSFTLHWTQPVDAGNLPLQSYTIEILLLGNSVCPQTDPEWDQYLIVDDPSATDAIVLGLDPFQQYQARIRANNSAHQSDPSEATSVVWTQRAAPSSPPSDVTAGPGGKQEITVSWQPPSSCLRYGGILTDYTVHYKIATQATFLQQRVGSNATSLTLFPLSSSSTYDIKVSAHNSEGEGPTSDLFQATTIAIGLQPPPPLDLKADPINSTAVRISWTTPTSPDVNIDLYIISWDSSERVVLADQSSTVIRGLEPGRTYVFSVQSNNEFGFSNISEVEVTTPSAEATSSDSITSQLWFVVMVAVVGTLVVVLVPAVLVCICCLCRNKSDGKIYITSRRSASSLSGASSGFSEYQQKHRGVSRATGITISPKPPPMRRSTDYADLDSYRSHTSTAPPSIASNYQRQHTDVEATDGTQGSYKQRDTPPLDQTQLERDRKLFQYPISPTPQNEKLSQSYNHMSSSSPDGPQDTMIRLPSPPPPNFPPVPFTERTHSGSIPRALSQDSDDSWSPADSLNYRGHMTNKDPANRFTSQNSRLSADSRGSGDEDYPASLNHREGRERGGRPSGAETRGSALSIHSSRSVVAQSQLPPVHENKVMEGPARDLGWHHRQGDSIAMHNLHHSQHSSQPHMRTNSSPPPPLPTSLPPPPTSPPLHTQSMDRMLDHVGPAELGRAEHGHVSMSQTQFHNHSFNPRTGTELHHGFSQPVLPAHPPTAMPGVSGEKRSPSPVYAEPLRTPQHAQWGGNQVKSNSHHQSVPNTDHTHHQSREKAWQTSSSSRQAPPLHTHLSQPAPTTDHRRGPPSYPHSRTLSLEQDHTPPPPTAFETRQRNLKEELLHWKSAQEALDREKGHGERMPQNGYPSPALFNGPAGLNTAVPSQTMNTNPHHSSLQNFGPPGVPTLKNGPPHPLSEQHKSRHSHSHSHSHSRRRAELEGIYQLDPHKPQRRQGKVPGAVWKQMPMSSRIESSSDSESGSDCESENSFESVTEIAGDNTSMYSEYV